MNELAMYWMTRTDAVRDVCAFVGTVAFVSAVLASVLVTMAAGSDEPYDMRAYSDRNDTYDRAMKFWHERWDAWLKWRKAWLFTGCAVGLCMMFAHALLPTGRELAAIVVVPRIVQAKPVDGMADGVMESARRWMEDLRRESDGK